MASRLWDFTKMNPPTFCRSKAKEYHQEFIDEVNKIIYDMGLTTSEKVEFAIFQLNDMVQAWYVQWKDNRPLRGGPITWKMFKKAFLDRLFPRAKRENKVVEFINFVKEV